MSNTIWPLSDSQIAEFQIGGNKLFITKQQKETLMDIGQVFVSTRTKKGFAGKNGDVCIDELYIRISDNSFPIIEQLINFIGETKPDEVWVDDKFTRPGERIIRMWWD